MRLASLTRGCHYLYSGLGLGIRFGDKFYITFISGSRHTDAALGTHIAVHL
jgi:hypothetical protein